MIAAYRRTHSPSLKVTLITVHYKLVFFLLLWLTDDGICCAERHTSILLHWNGTDCAVENEGSHVIGEFVDGLEFNSGTADARATVTWPSAEFAARLRPLPNCSFMCHSFHSRIFELLHWINTRTACAVCDDLTITYLRVTHDSASTATASDHRFKAKIVYIIIKILRYSCGAVSDLKSNISTGLHSAIRHLTLRLFFTTESVVC